jgi:hypothetical protein
MLNYSGNNDDDYYNPYKENSIQIIENPQTQDIDNRQNLFDINEENFLSANSANNERTDDKTKNMFLTRKKLGRKRKSCIDNGYISKHNKFSDDNLRRKIKHLVIKNLLQFVNAQIEKMKIDCPKLLILNQNQKFNATIKYNQDFLNKSLKEIFSEKISGRYLKYSPDHNQKVINILLNGPEHNYFVNLLNLTFLNGLRHFRGSEEIDELKGMTLFEDIKINSDWEVDYKNVLSNYIMDYEIYISLKKARKKRRIKYLKN